MEQRPEHQIVMEEALREYKKKHGSLPKVIMLGDDIWRKRADIIAESMNRCGLGTDSSVVVHRLPAEVQGIICA